MQEEEMSVVGMKQGEEAVPVVRVRRLGWQRGWVVCLLVVVGVVLGLWGWRSFRMAREERIVAGIVARGGEVRRVPTELSERVTEWLKKYVTMPPIQSKINLAIVFEPTDEELSFLGEGTEIHLFGITNRGLDQRVLEVLGRQERLETIVVGGRVGDADLTRLVDTLQHPELVENFGLSETTLTDESLKTLSRMSGLELLVIEKSEICGSGMEQLAGMDLKKLHLKNAKITDNCVKEIVKNWAKKIRDIDLSGSEVTDAGLELLAGFPKLVGMNLGGTKVTPAGFRKFLEIRKRERLKPLERLGISDLPWSVSDLKTFEFEESLSTLDVSGWKIRDKDLDELMSTVRIPELNVSRTEITDAALTKLSACEGLISLEMRGTGVTDAGLLNIKDSTSLVSLGLGETRITYAGLMKWKRPKGLMGFDVTGMGLSVEEMRTLAKHLDVQVVSEYRIFLAQ